MKLRTKEAADAAAILRAHPELVQDLHWHMAAEAALILSNLGAFEFATKNLQRSDRGDSRVDGFKDGPAKALVRS